MAEPLSAAGVSWRLGAVLLLVLLNGFFVAAEFAIVKVRASQIEALAQRGDARARRAKHLVDNLNPYLNACQLGITLASLGLGWIGEPTVARLIEPGLVAAGVGTPALVHTIAFAIAFTFITVLHIVIGEVVPKTLAIQRAHATTYAVAWPLRTFRAIFLPFIWMLNGSANVILRLMGVNPASEAEHAHSEEELRLLLSESGEAKALPRRKAEILINMLDLRDRTVHEIMVPRTQVTALSTAATVEQNVRVARESGYTRFPLAKAGNLDEIVGMVHLKDLVWYSVGAQPGAKIDPLRRDILVVPGTLGVESLLNKFLARRAHMALVLDEHGGTAGIVTLEDVIEEFLGEIQDEFDTDEASLIRALGDDEWIVDGAAPLHRVAEVLETEMESEDASTFGGYIVERTGRVPHAGSEVDLGAFRGTIRSADRKRVKTVHIVRR